LTDLVLRLFGPGALLATGRPVRPHSAKAFALLAFLVFEADRAHARSRLADLLWAGSTDATARHSLRQALHSLRTIAGGALQDCLVTDEAQVRFVPGAGIDIDLLRFLQASSGPTPADWTEAASLYTGPFLQGRTYDDCEAFTEWLDATRARLHALAAKSLDRLVTDAMIRSDWPSALGHAGRLRDLDPASESVSRRMMRILEAVGDPWAVDAEWERLCTVLRSEFQASPSPQTRDLHRAVRQALRAESFRPTAPVASVAPFEPDAPPAPVASATTPPRGPGEAESFIRAARAADGVYAYGNAIDLYDRALHLLESGGSASRQRLCSVLLLKEAALERLGRRTEQQATIDRALAVAGALDDPGTLAAVLLRQAGAFAYTGRIAPALESAHRALDLYRAIGDGPGQAEGLRELGFVFWRAEDPAAALRCAREALDLHRQIGDVAGEATALHNLAEIHRGLGSPAQARDWYDRAIPLHWASRNRAGEVLTLFGIATALRQEDDDDGATRAFEAALAMSERYGERTMQARALHALAMHRIEHDRLDAALGLLERAVAIDRAIGYAHALGHDLVDLSDVHALRGERTQSTAALQEALVWFLCTDDMASVDTTRRRLEGPGGADDEVAASLARRGRIKSHLPLAEGKVYCAFESPLAQASRAS